MTWLFLALLTAIFWGLTYASTEQVTRFVDPKTYLTFSCVVGAILYSLWGYFDGTLSKDLNTGGLQKGIGFALLASLAAFIASYCSVAAVKLGGASYASIVEISYPVWVVAFLWLMTGANTLSWNMVIGGLVIFAGTTIVLLGKS